MVVIISRVICSKQPVTVISTIPRLWLNSMGLLWKSISKVKRGVVSMQNI